MGLAPNTRSIQRIIITKSDSYSTSCAFHNAHTVQHSGSRTCMGRHGSVIPKQDCIRNFGIDGQQPYAGQTYEVTTPPTREWGRKLDLNTVLYLENQALRQLHLRLTRDGQSCSGDGYACIWLCDSKGRGRSMHGQRSLPKTTI